MSRYEYKVKIEKVRRGKLEAGFHYDVELYENGNYLGIYNKSKHSPSGYAYTLKTAKKRALRVILDHDAHSEEFGVVILERGTVDEMKELLDESEANQTVRAAGH